MLVTKVFADPLPKLGGSSVGTRGREVFDPRQGRGVVDRRRRGGGPRKLEPSGKR